MTFDPGIASDPPARSRPASTAVLLALGIAGAGLIQGTNAFLERNHLADGLNQVGRYMSAENAIYRTTDLRGSVVLAIWLGALAVGIFAPLAVLLSLGKRWARVLTWILGTGMIIGQVILMASDSSAVKTGEFVRDVDVPGGDANTVSMLNTMLVPRWFPPVHYVTELLLLVGLVLLCIQLARPTVAEYFAKESPEEGTDDRVWSTSQARRD